MEEQKSKRRILGGGIARLGLWFDDRKIAIGMVLFLSLLLFLCW